MESIDKLIPDCHASEISKITVKIESKAIQELQSIYDRIDERLSSFDPSEEIKKKVVEELRKLENKMDVIEEFVRDHIHTIKELLGIDPYIM